MEDLSGTAYVILGMLSFGPGSGYDIKGGVDRSTRFFWAASYGQIYPELRRLEREGLIAGEDDPAGERKRRVYRLTQRGRKELVAWLSAPPAMPELRDESLLKLFFADALPFEQALEQLRMRREGQEQFLAVLRMIGEHAGEDPPFMNLVWRYGVGYAEWNIEWCKRQERRLRAGKEVE